ncbi:xylulose kinase-2 [Actinidia rufa]|uniref:Xylulose kinase-2 n=1 Tax=Actinidia rufa TaxID=165716 RepID=A0A7J0GN75_9ERIC|nr:xylulose kinase-2 [Actinidia rufa]
MRIFLIYMGTKQGIDQVMPAGYIFVPTDQELVFHYLKKKDSRKPLPAQCIMEMDAISFYNQPPMILGTLQKAKRTHWRMELYRLPFKCDAKLQGAVKPVTTCVGANFPSFSSKPGEVASRANYPLRPFHTEVILVVPSPRGPPQGSSQAGYTAPSRVGTFTNPYCRYSHSTDHGLLRCPIRTCYFYRQTGPGHFQSACPKNPNPTST